MKNPCHHLTGVLFVRIIYAMNSIREFAKDLIVGFQAESDPAKAQAFVEGELARLMYVAKTYRKSDKGPSIFTDADEIIVDNMRQRLVDFHPSSNEQ